MYAADDLQVRIMKEIVSPGSFQWNAKESYANIAKRVGVDAETVRKRVLRMQDQGVILGWQLIPNPHLLGMESAGIDLDLDRADRKAAIISQIKLIDNIIFVLSFHGSGIQVLLYYDGENDLSRKSRLISSISGCETPVQWSGGLPPCNMRLRRTDWQILKVLRQNSRSSLANIAKSINTSSRTVKRRLTLMTDSRAFYLLTRLDFRRVPGLNCRFIIYCEDEGKKSIVDKEVRRRLTRIFFSFTDAKGFLIYSVLSRNTSEAEETLKWLKGLDGISNVRMGIMEEFSLADDWFDAEIERHLSEPS